LAAFRGLPALDSWRFFLLWGALGGCEWRGVTSPNFRAGCVDGRRWQGLKPRELRGGLAPGMWQGVRLVGRSGEAWKR
jgi:hypothetical protein